MGWAAIVGVVLFAGAPATRAATPPRPTPSAGARPAVPAELLGSDDELRDVPPPVIAPPRRRAWPYAAGLVGLLAAAGTGALLRRRRSQPRPLDPWQEMAQALESARTQLGEGCVAEAAAALSAASRRLLERWLEQPVLAWTVEELGRFVDALPESDPRVPVLRAFARAIGELETLAYAPGGGDRSRVEALADELERLAGQARAVSEAADASNEGDAR
ncbi:MAG: hypothetical protein D6776_08020 [Planctomycetota bacterium]|nr:MAG: hypothetical protein D6776_08020 [Planctomycetota bacterium]